MIYLGADSGTVSTAIDAYCEKHVIERVFLFSPTRFPIMCGHRNGTTFKWKDIIEYKHYYRILQETDNKTLIVVNQALRTQDRSDLTYNCLRNFLQQTKHQIIVSHLPIIGTKEDFCILFDLDTRSQWRRTPFDELPIGEAHIVCEQQSPSFTRVDVTCSQNELSKYVTQREKMFNGLGAGDPHTIPRQLHMISGKLKFESAKRDSGVLCRNKRLGKTAQTYRDDRFPRCPYSVIDFPHRFIDFADMMCISRQTHFETYVSDLPVDEWYFSQYSDWAQRITDVYSAIHG